MDSNTSSENFNVNDLKYIDTNGNNINSAPSAVNKKDTSETDLYLNMVANQSKILQESEKSSSSLKLDNSSEKKSSTINSSSQKSSVTSKANFEEISFGNDKKKSKSRRKSENRSNTRSEVNSETYSDRFREKTPVKIELTPQQIRMKKIELLRKLCELKQKGYKLSKEYDFNSSLEDMEYEYDLLKSFANKRNGIKLYKNVLLNVCSVTEFLNDKYDPFSFQLSGWSEHMSVEVDSYDDVLEELYEKYKGKGGTMPPEMKLLFLVLASASAFHFSKSHLSNMPGLDKVMQNNPGFIPNMVNGTKQTSQFMTEQEIHLEKLRKEMQQKERDLKKQQKEHQQRVAQNANREQYLKEQQIKLNTKQNDIPTENYQNAHHPVNLNSGHQNFNIPNTDSRQPPKIEKHQTVEDILGKLHARDSVNNTDTQDEMSNNNDRIVSDTSEARRRGRKKKTLMQIN